MRSAIDIMRRIGAGARLPLWCTAALLAATLFAASGCAGCTAGSGSGDLLATTQQAIQNGSGAAAESSSSSSSVSVEAFADDNAESAPEPEAEPDSESAAEAAESTPEDAAAAPKASKSNSSNDSSASKSRSSSSSASSSSAASKQKEAISVEVAFDSSNAAKHNSKFPSSLGAFTVELKPGATVYDALVATGVTFTMKGGNYIDSIGGIAEKQCGAGSGWMYAVNGKFPGKSAMKLELADGDKVRWAYTVTMGDV